MPVFVLECTCLRMPEAAEPLGTGVTNCCEPQEAGAGTSPQVLWKSPTNFLLTAESSLQTEM